MNKKMILALVVVLCLGPAAALAGEQEKKEKSGIFEWLKTLQKKIAQIVPKQGVPVSTAVAGVRGAKGDPADKVYWKGKKNEEAVTEEEMAVFKEGIDLAARGERPAAIKEFETFMAKYPDSPLIPDAKKTLDLVKAEPKADEHVEQKPAAKEEKTVEKEEETKEQAIIIEVGK